MEWVGGGRLWCIWIMLFQFLKWNSLPKLKAALSPTSGVDQAEKLTAEWVSVGGETGYQIQYWKLESRNTTDLTLSSPYLKANFKVSTSYRPAGLWRLEGRYNNSTLTQRKRQALIHHAFFWIPAQYSNPGNTAEVCTYFINFWGWRGEWGSVGVGVVASLVRNDCSFPAERACLAPAFRHKIFGKRES